MTDGVSWVPHHVSRPRTRCGTIVYGCRYCTRHHLHVTHAGLGPKLELTHNEAWGEHCRAQAIAHAGLVNQHLSDGRHWLLGGDAPTFCDMTLCVAIAFGKFGPNQTPLDERFEFIDAYWQRWKARPSFQLAYRDGAGLAELAELSKQK